MRRVGLPCSAWGRLLSALVCLCGVQAAAWTQSRADAHNGAYVELSGLEGGKPRAWTFEGEPRVLGYEPGMTVWSPPALGKVEGRGLLVAGGYDHFVWAFDAASGEVRWKYATGDGVWSAPLLWEGPEGAVVLVGSNDRAVYALEAGSGRRLWSTSLEEYRATLGTARVAPGCVGRAGQTQALFVSSWVHDRSLGASLQRGAVSALSVKDGRRLWSTTVGDNEVTAPVCAEVGGRWLLFAGASDGNLHALDAASGEAIWKHTEHDGIKSPPAVISLESGEALVITGSRYGAVRALEAATGRPRWHLKTADRITGSPAAATVGGRSVVFVPSYDRHLYALEAGTGKVLWRYAARAGFYGSPAFVPGERPLVLASAWDHSLHVVDALTGEGRLKLFTGQPLWDVSGLDASTWSSPVGARLEGTAMAFAGSYDGRLRALLLDSLPVERAGSRAAIAFWLSFPATLVPLVLVALWRTRGYRRRLASQTASTASGTIRKAR